MKRREFVKKSLITTCGLGMTTQTMGMLASCSKPSLYKISLAQWSLNKTLFAEKMDNLDFAPMARQSYGIEAVEYVNQFFKDKAKDEKYLAEMKNRADDVGVKNLLIMCDGEGRLGDPDDTARLQAVENHYKWVEAAKFLGCHSIRVNAASEGEFEEQKKTCCRWIEPVNRIW